MDEDLKKIKRTYGEDFMHLCRTLFPSLLEQEGLLYNVLSQNFADNSRTLYKDIRDNDLEEAFKNYIYSKIDVEKEEKQIIQEKTPYEILEEAGYTLYECHSEEEIQQFKKYFKPGEELCTFRGGRLNSCVVFFAVKKNVDEIKRENFENPQREDEYGTSVMSIQFPRQGRCVVSIKNRYNHTVNNPDATYGNDLDRIAPGLRESFSKLLLERGMHLDESNIEKLKIPGYVRASDGKYYKYNLESYGVYYCPGNVIINRGEIYKLEPEKKILIDNFILDLENKKIDSLQEGYHDSFTDAFDKGIEKIEIVKDKESKTGERIIRIKVKEQESIVEIRINRDNQIIGYKNDELREVKNSFLLENRTLQTLDLPKLERVENNFLYENRALQTLYLPKLESVGDNFLYENKALQALNLPNLQSVGNYFLACNNMLHTLNLPNLQSVGDDFLFSNVGIQTIYLPKLESVGNDFLYRNKALQTLDLPKLENVGNDFLYYNGALQTIDLPNFKIVGDGFLAYNNMLHTLNLPNLQIVGDGFLAYNNMLRTLNLPNLQSVGKDFLMCNKALQALDLPNLKNVEDDFLYYNESLRTLNLSNLKEFSRLQSMFILNLLKSNVEQNEKQSQKAQVTSKALSKLDKDSKVSSKLFEWAKRKIENLIKPRKRDDSVTRKEDNSR